MDLDQHRKDLLLIRSILIGMQFAVEGLTTVIDGMLERTYPHDANTDQTATAIECTHENAEDASAFGNARMLCKDCGNFIEADGTLVSVE